MAEIKPIDMIVEKWTRVTPGRTQDYKLGIQHPRRSWEENAIAGKENWKAGIDKAASQDMFAKGIQRAGQSKWQQRSLQKGPGRFSEGVTIAGPDYKKGFAPYRDAIAAADLGPRYPKRDPRNLDRVKRVVDALVKTKVGE